MNELILCESLTLRKELCTDKNTSVLEKVGQLVFLPKTHYTTLKNVALFYQVSLKTVETIVHRHSFELKEDGYKIFSKKDLENLQDEGLEIPNRGITVFPRRAILRIGMLLRDSLVAKKVRSYLLNIEEMLETQPRTRESLNKMAEQLNWQAIELGNHARQLEWQANEVGRNAEETRNNHLRLEENATQLTRNAEQLIFQSNLIKAMIEEMYENKHGLKKLEHDVEKHDFRLDLYNKRIEALEELARTQNEEGIEKLSEEQLELLKKRVKLKGPGMKVWGEFKKHFQVSRYRDLPKQKFREALDWLENYEF